MIWQVFDANTDPSYQYSEEGSKIYRINKKTGKPKRGEGLDANGDGKNDLGVLPFGVYKYQAFTSEASNKDLGDVFKPITDDRRGDEFIVTSIETDILAKKMKIL